MLKPTISNGFQLAAGITTVGSMAGTYEGIVPLMSAPLAALSAVALGIVSYGTLNFAWNHQGTAKRVGAASIAAAALCTSVWTIDLAAQANLQQNAQASQSDIQSALHAEQSALNSRDEALKSDIKAQLDRFAQADAADRADTALLSADVREQISALQSANESDQAQIAAYQILIKKYQRPQNNAANVRVAQSRIDARIKQISTLTAEIKSLSADLDNKLSARAAEVSKLTSQLATPAPVAKAAPSQIAAETPARSFTLIHSAIPDLCSFFFLLLSFLYAPVASVSKKTDEVLADMSIKCNDSSDVLPDTSDTMPIDALCIDQELSTYRAIIDQPKNKTENKPKLLSESELIESLSKFKITPNQYGRITPAQIAELTGLSTGNAKKLMTEQCVPAGVLDTQEDGRGVFFVYPSVVTRQMSLIQGGRS